MSVIRSGIRLEARPRARPLPARGQRAPSIEAAGRGAQLVEGVLAHLPAQHPPRVVEAHRLRVVAQQASGREGLLEVGGASSTESTSTSSSPARH